MRVMGKPVPGAPHGQCRGTGVSAPGDRQQRGSDRNEQEKDASAAQRGKTNRGPAVWVG